ncbi:MAG: response regulator [Nitrospira sp.]
MPKILIADDSIAVRKVAERLLTEAGFIVTLAANGEEALAYLAKEQPDVVVSDVIMPDKSGYEVCAFIRGQAALATTPVLLISGIVNDEVTKQAESCRADGVLKKPFQGTSLKDRVFELLAKRQESSPAAVNSLHPVQGTAAEFIAPGPGQTPQSGSQEASQIKELERQLQSERTRSEELTKRVGEFTAQLVRAKDIETQLTIANQRVSTLQQKVAMLEQQAARIPELEAALKSEQDAVHSLTQNSQVTSSRVAELESSLQQKVAMLEQQAARIPELEAALKSEQDVVHSLTQNFRVTSDRAAELESSLSAERAAAEQLVQQLTELEGISAKLKDAEARLANDQQRILEHQQALAALEAELLTERKKGSDTAQRMQELGRSVARVQELEGLLAAESERNGVLRQRVQESEQSAESATKRFDDLVRKLGEIAGLASQLGSGRGQS